MMKTLVKTFLKLLLAGGIIAFLIHKTPAGFMDTLLKASPGWIGVALVLYALHIFANAWRWRLLLKAQKIDCSLALACSLTMQSFFFSLVLPGAIGGDLVRVGFLAAHIQKGRKFDGAFTILIDRFTGMIGIFLVALLMLPFVWGTISSVSSGVIEKFIYVLLAGSLCGIAASVVVFNHKMLEGIPFYRKFQALGDRFTRGMYSRVTDALDSYGNCRREVVICIVTSIVFVNLVLGLMAYCVAVAVTGGFPSFGAVLAAITVGNIAGLLPTTPSGVGTRDLFVIPILRAGGIPADSAMAISLTITAIILLFNLSGGLFFLLSPGKKQSGTGEAEKTQEPDTP